MIDTTMTNRIESAAQRLREALNAGLRLDGKPLTVDPAELDREQNLSVQEWMAYQNAQARAHATGKLTTGEAQTVYMALGGEIMSTTGWSSSTDLALKVTITRLMGELMGLGR